MSTKNVLRIKKIASSFSAERGWKSVGTPSGLASVGIVRGLEPRMRGGMFIVRT
jgi:hypothetical protein